jgi:hypothetical protein
LEEIMRRLGRYAGIAVAATMWLGLACGAEFSADTVDQGPQGVMSRGKLFVAGDRMRRETSRGGVEMVTIVDKAQGRQWTLYPADHSYVEMRANDAQPSPENPCAGLQRAVCNLIGTETISGRSTNKWEVAIQRNDGVVRTYHWIDAERGIPLRQEFPDGARIHWRRIALDRVEGRNVEKWQVMVDRSGQAPMRAFHWFDPELNMSIREETAGGFVRELRNIEVGPQSDDLFRVPVDFRQVTPMAPGMAPAH